MNEQDKRIQSRILDVLNRARQAGAGILSKDAVSAAIALDDQIATEQGLLNLLLSGEIDAKFDGDEDADRGNVELYSFQSTKKGNASAKKIIAKAGIKLQ